MDQNEDLGRRIWQGIPSTAAMPLPRPRDSVQMIYACMACGTLRGAWCRADDIPPDALSRVACLVCAHVGAQLAAQFTR